MTLPPLRPEQALFLDFDGTLVDLAPSPERIVVEPGLVRALQMLQQDLQGAVAIISGRPIAEIDRWLSPLKLPVAGVHGAERRRADGLVQRRGDGALQQVLAVAERLAQQHAGVWVERKSAAVALHYRDAPQAGPVCRQALVAALADLPSMTLLPGKCVFEVLPTGVSKGHALAHYMAEAPFAGRQPVFIGDDVTDEAGFIEMPQWGGLAVKVGPGDTAAPYRLGSAEDVRRWLRAAASLNENQEDWNDASTA